MLVVIEGIDGAGKGTLAKRLAERLQTEKFKAAVVNFPQYEKTSYGKIVGRYLNGEFQQAQHPLMHGTLFAVDRFEFKPQLEELLFENNFVICDRYVPSNLCYSAMLASPEEREDVIQHFFNLEYRIFQMPMPQVIFVLNLPIDRAIEHIALKSKRSYTDRSADIFEEDKKYLEAVKSFYANQLEKCHPDSKVRIIECVQNDRLLSIDEIAEEAHQTLNNIYFPF